MAMRFFSGRTTPGLVDLSVLAVVVGMITKEHIADSVAESVKPYAQ